MSTQQVARSLYAYHGCTQYVPFLLTRQMLWNWYTIDACFLSSGWHITSTAGFAGTCIGVILLAITLEFLRRLSEEYDHELVRAATGPRCPSILISGPMDNKASRAGSRTEPGQASTQPPPSPRPFKPRLLQQAVRALLRMLQSGVAYMIML
jgi:copper transporter 1